MKTFLIILTFATLSAGYHYHEERDDSGLQYNGLRVKFGWSAALKDKEYFFNIPRTVNQAESRGWRRTERPPGPLPELKMYCPPGRYVCPLFNAAGFVAGLQLALPADAFESPTINPEKRLVKWHIPATDFEPAEDYWTATQYYVSEESLKAGAGPRVENGATLQDDGVWVSDLEGKLMRIPSTQAELDRTLFKKQNCLPSMGTHYHWNMTRDKNCEEFYHWFPLTTGGELVGVGFQFFGSLHGKLQGREWFERWYGKDATWWKNVVPDAPECYYDFGVKHGAVGLHVYFIDDPWKIRCH